MANISFAQKNILELMPGSERLTFNEKLGANMLAGNVHFIYQGNNMYCDSAVYFEDRQYVKAYGHVHIQKKGEMNLFCDSLWYDGKTEIANLWSHVRARDQEYKLTTDSMEYYSGLDRAVYRHGGRVESNDGKDVLTSKIGYFYPDQKSFIEVKMFC
jgi:lipopolysaccharide assembly outer membrane protein LptD (OstA)